MEVKGNLTPEKRAVNVAETDDQSKRQRREPMRGVVLDRVLSPKRSEGGGMEFLHPEVQIPSVPTAVTMSRIDKASTIKLSDCLLKVMSVKGYRTVRFSDLNRADSELPFRHGPHMVYQRDAGTMKWWLTIWEKLGIAESVGPRNKHIFMHQ